MLSGHDFAPIPSSFTDSLPAGVRLRRLPIDDAWPIAPPPTESRVLDDWLPQRRRHRNRMQRMIDSVESQVVLLDAAGEIVAVNRAWRLSASLQGLNDAQYGIGRCYLSLCRAAAADGC